MNHLVIAPLLLYHLIQLMIAAPIARVRSNKSHQGCCHEDEGQAVSRMAPSTHRLLVHLCCWRASGGDV